MAEIPHSNKYSPTKSKYTPPRNNQHQGGYSYDQTRGKITQKPTNKTEGCFIATAVYGSYNNPSVVVLREFRDTFLKKSVPGKATIAIYYKYSPGLANWLINKPLLKKLTKLFLTQVVTFVQLFLLLRRN
jgi:hypothetical protein